MVSADLPKSNQQNRKIIVIGDATLDLNARFARWPSHGQAQLVDQMQLAPGGTGFNVAIGLARLGLPVTFIGTLSSDTFGSYLRKFAATEKVSLGVRQASSLPTRIVLTKVGVGGESSFLAFNRPAADDDLDTNQVDLRTISKASLMFATGVALRFEPSRTSVIEMMKLARKADVPVAFDPNLRCGQHQLASNYRRTLCLALQLADFYLPNLSEELRIRNVDSVSRLRKVHSQATSTIIIKNGSRGCRLVQNGTITSIATHRIKVMDKTGAGDAFNVGFLFAIYHGYGVERACRMGNLLGLLNTTVLGASSGMPTLDDVNRYISTKVAKSLP
jgi:sugar/nucleoside kinase (ribokinase family)